MAGAVNKANMANKVVAETIQDEWILLRRSHWSVAQWSHTFGVVAFVNFGIGIAKLDCDVALKFILKPDSMDSGQSLDNRGFAVSYMANSSDVDGSLPANNFRRERCQLCDIQIGQVLSGKMRLPRGDGWERGNLCFCILNNGHFKNFSLNTRPSLFLTKLNQGKWRQQVKSCKIVGKKVTKVKPIVEHKIC